MPPASVNPEPPTGVGAAQLIEHYVRPGETWGSIAGYYGVSEETVIRQMYPDWATEGGAYGTATRPELPAVVYVPVVDGGGGPNDPAQANPSDISDYYARQSLINVIDNLEHGASSGIFSTTQFWDGLADSLPADAKAKYLNADGSWQKSYKELSTAELTELLTHIAAFHAADRTLSNKEKATLAFVWSLIPIVGDGTSLAKQAINWATGREVDKADFFLSGIGLVMDGPFDLAIAGDLAVASLKALNAVLGPAAKVTLGVLTQQIFDLLRLGVQGDAVALSEAMRHLETLAALGKHAMDAAISGGTAAADAIFDGIQNLGQMAGGLAAAVWRKFPTLGRRLDGASPNLAQAIQRADPSVLRVLDANPHLVDILKRHPQVANSWIAYISRHGDDAVGALVDIGKDIEQISAYPRAMGVLLNTDPNKTQAFLSNSRSTMWNLDRYDDFALLDYALMHQEALVDSGQAPDTLLRFLENPNTDTWFQFKRGSSGNSHLTRLFRGPLGELQCDRFLREQHGLNRWYPPGNGEYPAIDHIGERGIDGIYKNANGDWVIAEFKWKNGELGNAKYGDQMSPEWIRHHIMEMLDDPNPAIRRMAQDIRNNGFERILVNATSNNPLQFVEHSLGRINSLR